MLPLGWCRSKPQPLRLRRPLWPILDPGWCRRIRLRLFGRGRGRRLRIVVLTDRALLHDIQDAGGAHGWRLDAGEPRINLKALTAGEAGVKLCRGRVCVEGGLQVWGSCHVFLAVGGLAASGPPR